MALQDLQDFFDPTLALPIRGKVYVIQSPDAETGIKVQRLFTIATMGMTGASLSAEDMAALQLDDAEELQTYAMVLGDAYAEMLADKVPWEWVKHAGTTAMMWVGLDRASAEAFWGAGSGEARRPATQDHKAPAKKRTRKAAAASPVSPDSSSESTPQEPETPSTS